MSFDRDHAPQPVILPPTTTSQYATDRSDTYANTANPDTMSSPSTDSAFVSRIQIYSTSLPKAYISPICGAGAGLASGIVTCPLDVIKTKLQAQGGFANATRNKSHLLPSSQVYRGIFGTGSTIWREEGLRGMYRGLGPMLMGYLPTWAVYLTVYENTREFYYDKCGSWWIARCYSSLTAGACSTVLTNPIWVIKTRLMSQSSRSTTDGMMRAPWHYTSTLDAAQKMWKAEGIRSFYSGLTPALLGLTHVAVQFPLYEWFKMKFTGYGMGEHPTDGSSHFVGISAATFLSKVCASTATYPHEVIRTRLQTQQRQSNVMSSDGMRSVRRYKGVLHTCKVMLAEEGWRAFYAGIGVNLVRAVPAAMTTMLTYEYLQHGIQELQIEGEKKIKGEGQPV
ncbi:Mitochondrial nicotinamide adenine dinucleotide transporter 1 [Cyphellophora attinorum]|uniref:Mitochondrial nicotinamide adenine dinucleotide transporter 1 n=1 Tax=Cyphellophora attinorum TaxID=1664694 RepID=A0A0N1HVV5_9EURO|nr:Mitochondrial nicotinamide adenine dinucleotide transporter 1 [Phialophora attinorum]KPI44085.1 Mitochondrial nicotinamide adenine dinucleotide transporter 1 [Phialophora attinorum]